MRIHGLGCSLVDNLYTPVDFSSGAYTSWEAGRTSKAGLITGGLVFGEDLEEAFGIPYTEIIGKLAGGLSPKRNIGGPAIVALIHMSQLADDLEIAYYGARSDDGPGRYLQENLSRFDLDVSNYLIREGGTPFTDVLSDPSMHDGHGERTFINYIGAAGEYTKEDLPDSFFDADILIYGGTALTPGIHDDLSLFMRKGKENGCLNFINTVYDFRNEKRDSHALWPLVEDYSLIDLIIVDHEEARRITGMDEPSSAAGFFLEAGVKSGIITDGAKDITCFSDGSLFREQGIFTMPVSDEATRWMRAKEAGEADTTGCGDNFTGGVYTSAALQLMEEPEAAPSLTKAAILGIVSGGFAGCCLGGVYYEEARGEKREKILPLIDAYTEQTGVSYA